MSINPQTSTLPLDIARMNVYKAMFLQLRPKQWAKNVLVFASAIFAGSLLESHALLYAILAFICFSFMASTIYIINDIVDVDKDRVHPDKCKRPIAFIRMYAILINIYNIINYKYRACHE